jgi:hypothetical protein
MTYQLTKCGVLRVEDDLHIPADTRNRHWREYQDWLSEGNQPLDIEPELEPTPEPTVLERVQAMSPDELQALRDLLLKGA